MCGHLTVTRNASNFFQLPVQLLSDTEQCNAILLLHIQHPTTPFYILYRMWVVNSHSFGEQNIVSIILCTILRSPRMVAKYCNQRFCMSVRLHYLKKLHVLTSRNFLNTLFMHFGRGSVLLCRVPTVHVMYWMTSYFHIIGHIQIASQNNNGVRLWRRTTRNDVTGGEVCYPIGAKKKTIIWNCK